MENLKLKSELISLEEQLEILEKAKINIPENNWGLCDAISYVINIGLRTGIYHGPYLVNISFYIPLFTRENAIIYGGCYNSGNGFWWEIDPFDFDSRINFLDWMIKKINIELEDKKQSDYWWKNVYYDLKSRFNFTDKIIKKLHLNK